MYFDLRQLLLIFIQNVQSDVVDYAIQINTT